MPNIRYTISCEGLGLDATVVVEDTERAEKQARHNAWHALTDAQRDACQGLETVEIERTKDAPGLSFTATA